MPANLTQPYLDADERFKAASTIEEKIAALEEMLTLLPKHKGTEKMHADLKSRLAKLRKGGDKKAGPARRTSELVIEREGAAQLLLLGAPNAGKSALVASLTNAPVEVTEYPFTTHKAVPGAMRYEDVRVQLLDMPSTSPEFVDPNLTSLARMADGVLLCVDLSSPDCLDQPDWVIRPLTEARITLEKGTVSGAPKQGPKVLPTIIVATKLDHPDGPDALELLREAVPSYPIVPTSIHQPGTLANFSRAVFDMLGMVRVYSKAPGKDPDMDAPFLLPIGATLLDFAAKVHLDFKDKLNYARVWGEGKYDGQRVARDYVLSDKDIIELHLR